MPDFGITARPFAVTGGFESPFLRELEGAMSGDSGLKSALVHKTSIASMRTNQGGSMLHVSTRKTPSEPDKALVHRFRLLIDAPDWVLLPGEYVGTIVRVVYGFSSGGEARQWAGPRTKLLTLPEASKGTTVYAFSNSLKRIR